MPNFWLDVPRLQRMQDAKSGNDLWMNINNDEAHRLQVWMQLASGKWTPLMGDESRETWQLAQTTVKALERVLLILNYLLASPVSSFSDVENLTAWFEAALPSTFYLEKEIAISILRSLGMEMVGMGSGKERAGGRELNELVILRTNEAYSPRWSGRTFDVFVSYKHVRYAEHAASLVSYLEALGLECWFDRAQLRLISGTVVVAPLRKRWLREALAASTCTVFFETALEATADNDFRGNQIAFNWQVYEHRYARNVAYIRPEKGELYFKDGGIVTWGTTPELAQLIAGHVRGLPSSRRVDAEPPEEEADLACAVNDLQQQGHEYSPSFNSATPLTAMAMLAPVTVSAGLAESRPYADDVLLALARYDPKAALALQSAGIDLLAMLAVGSKVQRGRWSDSSTYRWADVLGYNYRPPLPTVFTEIDLFKGLAANVASGAGKAQKLLQLTLRFMHKTWTEDETDQEVQRIAHELIPYSPEDEQSLVCRHGRHGWFIVRSGDALRAVPVVRYGALELNTDCRPLPVNAAVFVQQTRYLFPKYVMTDAEGILNGDLEQEPFDRLLERRPELALTFTGTPVPCTGYLWP